MIIICEKCSSLIINKELEFEMRWIFTDKFDKYKNVLNIAKNGYRYRFPVSYEENS